ncbi:MAG: LysM peptidoglycan-binding domain-containing protein [Proteobacteria bacterium]|nr:LysM peptidoglycan-binding domain-containing protein [Pseudomonadota bacterium]
MLPWAVIQAAGLGKLTLNSALGQPLAAEIDIVTTSSDDVSSLKASIAPREAFTQAGISYEPVLSTIKTSVESRANGSPYIKLSSPQAINDPFLMVLLELNWSSGRILREYTVLLDPIEANTQNIAAANTNSTPVIVATQLNEEKAPADEKDKRGVNSSGTKTKNNAPGSGKKSYGPVKRGDTLSSIARQVLPAGVDLNQMLVALYHANRDAFIADNMNLLKTGTVLKIPEKNEIAAVDASTAQAEIKMQTADWRSYRSKLATISRESPAQHTISQSDQGQITTTLDKKSVATPHVSKEVLKLSSGAQLPDKDGKIPDSTLVDRLRMMEEDAIARNLALKEANERVAMLEKSIENLKQLLELKDSVLAQAQLKADPTHKTAVKPEMQSSIAAESLPGKDTKTELSSAVVPAQQPLAVQPASEATAKSPPVTAPPPASLAPDTENRSWIDLLFGYIEYIAGALILGLLLVLLMIKRRRKQQEAVEEEEDTRKENFSSAMRSRMSTMAATGAAAAVAADSFASENTEDDLTYQNLDSYSEDEEFDKEAKYDEDHAPRHEAATELPADDEPLIADLQSDEQPVSQNVRGDFAEDYEQPVDSGSDATSSVNQIDFDLSDEVDEIKHHAALNQSLADDEAGLLNAGEDSKAPESAADYALEINFDDSEKSLDAVNLNDDNVFDNEKMDLDFDLGDSTGPSIDLTKDEAASEIEFPSTGDESAADRSETISGLRDEPLEFDQIPDIAQKAPAANISELELAHIDLNLEDSGQENEKEENLDLSEKSEQWQEVETKLDLAKAYQEMDDKEGAREMLEEVIRDGDEKQKKAAKQMLKSL